MDGIPAFVYRQKGLIAHLACGLDAYAGEIAKLQRSLAALQMEYDAPVPVVLITPMQSTLGCSMRRLLQSLVYGGYPRYRLKIKAPVR